MKKNSRVMNLWNIALAMFCLACASGMAKGQDIVYDWANKELISSPSRVNRTRTYTVRIKNINNILYTYRVTHTSEAVPTDDLAKILDLLKKSLPAGNAAFQPSGCQQLDDARALIETITSSINNSDVLPFKLRAMKPPVRSILLQDTLGGWAPIQKDLDTLRVTVVGISSCNLTQKQKDDFEAELTTFNALVNPIEAKVKSSHEYIDSVQLSPGNKEHFDVEELFNGVTTQDGKKSFEFTPGSNILTLSGGVLFSRVPNQSYEARKSPDSSENVLVVQGNSKFRPEGVALLNYLIPYLDNDTAGLAISAGPVVRFGGTGDTSSLGFFTGISGHLYHRFYVTPGVHFGQFADFPVGFFEGRTVPANFGELTPIKRWTARFALGISFQTAGFGSNQTAKLTESSGDGNSNDKKGGASGDGKGSKGSGKAAVDGIEDYNTLGSGLKLPLIRASVNSSEALDGSVVTLYADAPLGECTTLINGRALYILIPKANVTLGKGVSLSGRNFSDARIEQSGENVVVSFVLRPGVTARVEEKFNRLKVYLLETSKGQSSSVLASAEPR